MSWRDVLKALSKLGFKPVRQRGSHIIVENVEGLFAIDREILKAFGGKLGSESLSR